MDRNRAGTETKAVSPAAIYFYHSKRFSIRNCVARKFAGDGITTQFVEDPIIANCEAYGNAALGIHLGTGALRGIIRNNRRHHNDDDGSYLCYRVQHGIFEEIGREIAGSLLGVSLASRSERHCAIHAPIEIRRI